MARSRRQITPIAAPGAEALPLHMTFRISPELRERLAAAAGDRPIGEEIRRRLEASFVGSPAEADDPKTRQFLEALADMASRLAQIDPEWHDDPDLFRAFRQAVTTVLVASEPPGEPQQSERLAMAFTAMLAGAGVSRLTKEFGARIFLEMHDKRSAKKIADLFEIEIKEIPDETGGKEDHR
jgi:hypothetical protein